MFSHTYMAYCVRVISVIQGLTICAQLHIITCHNRDTLRMGNTHSSVQEQCEVKTTYSSSMLRDVWTSRKLFAVPLGCSFPNFFVVSCTCIYDSETISWSVLGSCLKLVPFLRVQALTSIFGDEMFFRVRTPDPEWITLCVSCGIGQLVCLLLRSLEIFVWILGHCVLKIVTF